LELKSSCGMIPALSLQVGKRLSPLRMRRVPTVSRNHSDLGMRSPPPRLDDPKIPSPMFCNTVDRRQQDLAVMA
jgi:hypothetical protein